MYNMKPPIIKQCWGESLSLCNKDKESSMEDSDKSLAHWDIMDCGAPVASI